MVVMSQYDGLMNRKHEREYRILMSVDNLSKSDSESALKHIGRLTDLSFDLRKEAGLRKAIELCEEFKQRELMPAELATLQYFEANAWHDVHVLLRGRTESTWEWDLPEVEREIVALRLATRAEQIDGFRPLRLCQIFTNLGNALSHLGRFVEAFGYWRKALAIEPKFPMALANLGFGFRNYALTVYDQGHARLLLQYALQYLTQGLQGNLHPSSRSFFEQLRSDVEKRLGGGLEVGQDLDAHSLGDKEAEQTYRRWCLEEGLFVNPLNDLGVFAIAAIDVLTAPNIVVGVEEGPYLHGFYNTLKQEYVSARYLYYEGVKATEPHFSDREVLLYNTLDYPSYGLAMEKVRTAYRITYSLFDKIAYFLNSYLRLGLAEKAVNFRTIWYTKKKNEWILRDEFHRRKNWPFRGLYWLAKDLYTDDSAFREAMEPDAQRLKEIRDHLEHKYLKVHTELWTGPSSKLTGLTDTLAYSVRRDELNRYTLRLLILARAALIYLSLGVHAEERLRKKQRGDSPVAEIPLAVWEDEWKV